jgi:tripartite-type tricarboxylate transporter receptor subunit TctC
MKYLLALIFSLVIATANAKETINIYTKFSHSGVPIVILSQQVKLMNELDTRFGYKINSILGAEGESAIARTFVESKNSKVLLYAAGSDFTVLENKLKNGYDKFKDFLFLHSLQSSDFFLLVPKKSGITTVKQLVDNLRQKDTIFVSLFATTKLSKTLADNFLSQLNLTNNVRYLNFADLSHISLSLVNNEFDFMFFDAFSLSFAEANILMVNSDKRSNYFDVPTAIEMKYENLMYNNITFFATTKNNHELASHTESIISKTCSDHRMLELLQKYKRVSFCKDSRNLTDLIEKDYERFKK